MAENMAIRNLMRGLWKTAAAGLAVLLITMSMSVCAFAADSADTETDEYSEEYNGYQMLVYDAADLLTDEEEEQLYDDMNYILDYGNAMFLSVELEQGYDYEEFAESVYYEVFGNEPGVIFQIDMGNRKLTLSASTDMETMIGSERDSIVDNIYTYATDGDYYRCASECFYEILTVIEGGIISHKMKHINNAIFALTFALILNFMIISRVSKKKVSRSRMLGKLAAASVVTSAAVSMGRISRRYSPKSSGSSGGGSSGGGGGGFSGGSSSHGF